MTERGAMAVVMTAAVALLAVLLTATSSLGLLYAARSQAALAADAAALAAAVATYPATGRSSPPFEAARAAAANGAVVIACSCRVEASLRSRVAMVRTLIEVEVPLFGVLRVTGASRAEFDPESWLGR
ncbi:MAG: hypothetical protein WD269_02495 [Acidimicrobiia bacterium]